MQAFLVGIGIAQHGAVTVFMPNLHYRIHLRDALLIACHLGNIPDAKFPGGLADPGLITNQDNFNILQPHPGLDGVPLDDIDMRIGERLGGRENGKKGHQSSLSPQALAPAAGAGVNTDKHGFQ